MYKRNEIKELTTDGIISNIFYYGIEMCNEQGTKQAEKELKWHCEELAKRGIVADGEELYKRMCI